MNQQTLELLRALQSSERDAQAFEHIRSLLASQRSHLVAEDDRATLADLSELLEVWAETATPDLAGAATSSAAQIADEDLEQAERAVQLYVLSLERAPGAGETLERLDALLCRRGERERLESILGVHVKALRERSEVDPERTGAVLRRLGELRVDRGGDLNPAIEAYEQALDLAADPETIRTLADLYAKRAAPGDDVQAADLYSTLGDVMGAPDGAEMLERALDQAPGHDAALDLLESYVPIAEQPTRLKRRWAAYVERSDNESGVDKRRLLLARAHAAAGEHREALICIGPLVDKAEPEALRLQAAFLANLHGEQEQQQQQAPAATDGEAAVAAKSGNGKSVKRPATLVGFRLPPGEGVPEVAAPPPADAVGSDAQPGDGAEAEAGDDTAGDAAKVAASARNAFAARSGETLVGFRMPIGKTSVATEPTDQRATPVADAPEAIAASAAGAARSESGKGGATRPFEDRGSGERIRGDAESGAATPQSARSNASGAGDASRGRAASSGTAAAAAARAAGGPAALSAALSASRSSSPGTQPAAPARLGTSSPGTQPAAPARLGTSSPGTQPAASARLGTSSPGTQPAAAAQRTSPGLQSAPAAESPAARAAALKASRSSSPPPASSASAATAAVLSASSSPARRASSPPPLKRRSSGAAAASASAAASAQPVAFGGPAALAATMPMPIAAAPPAAIAAPMPAATPAAEPEAAAAFAPQAAAPAVLPRSKPLDGDLDAFAARKRKIDPRWLAAGGVAAAAVIVGVIWTSGGSDAPTPSDTSSVSATGTTTGTSAAVGSTAAAPSAPAAPTPPPAAAVAAAPAAAGAPAGAATAPASATAATLAAAVAPKSAPAASAAAAPASSSRRARSSLDIDVGDVRVRGGLAAKAVSSAIDDNLSKIESCYADAVERKPGIEGKLTFSFNIDKAGKATRVRKQSGTIKDTALQRCSTEAIEKMRFPKAKKKPAQVTLPLEYSK